MHPLESRSDPAMAPSAETAANQQDVSALDLDVMDIPLLQPTEVSELASQRAMIHGRCHHLTHQWLR